MEQTPITFSLPAGVEEGTSVCKNLYGIAGHIQSHCSAEPVDDVDILIDNVSSGEITDSDGNYTKRIPIICQMSSTEKPENHNSPEKQSLILAKKLSYR
ncbi:MAG: NADPH-dependent curcumin reductase CurA [Polaribacter sp.]|jgi:NADPH-dependent curcumin reductase CurA